MCILMFSKFSTTVSSPTETQIYVSNCLLDISSCLSNKRLKMSKTKNSCFSPVNTFLQHASSSLAKSNSIQMRLSKTLEFSFTPFFLSHIPILYIGKNLLTLTFKYIFRMWLHCHHTGPTSHYVWLEMLNNS